MPDGCAWDSWAISYVSQGISTITTQNQYMIDLLEGLSTNIYQAFDGRLSSIENILQNWNPLRMEALLDLIASTEINNFIRNIKSNFQISHPDLDYSKRFQSYDENYKFYKFAYWYLWSSDNGPEQGISRKYHEVLLDEDSFDIPGVYLGGEFNFEHGQPDVFLGLSQYLDEIQSDLGGGVMGFRGSYVKGTIVIPKIYSSEPVYDSSTTFDFIQELLSGINADNYYKKFAGTLAIPAATLPALGGVAVGGSVAIATTYIVTDLVAKFAAISSAPKLDLLLALNVSQFIRDLVEQYKNDRERHQLQHLWDLMVAGRFPDGNIFQQYDVYRDSDWWPFDEPIARRCSHWENRSLTNAFNFGCSELVPEGENPEDEHFKVIKEVAHWVPGLEPPTCNYGYFKKAYPFKSLSDQVFYLPEEFSFFFPLWFGKAQMGGNP